MEEILEGGQGPPRAVVPLERERERECMDIQVLKNERNDTPATFLFYHIIQLCVYYFKHFSSRMNNRHHHTSQSQNKQHVVFSAGKYSVWNILVCHIRFFKKHITRFYNNFMILTFRGLCIVIYSYNKSQWDALFLNFIWQRTLHV